MKQDLILFGDKGESYADILGRLVESAKKRQLQDLLMNEENTISAKDALKEAKELWPA
jgi:predicted CopG family antitoxin